MPQPATAADTQGILHHIDQILTKIEFYQKKNSEQAERVKRNLQHIIHKASLERDEVDLIRGMLKKIEGKL
jgi:tRNA/rRNA methyltransferase